MNIIREYFNLDKLGINIKIGFLAGLITFVSISYILLVNPNVLGVSGMNRGMVFTATALTSTLGCSIMGLASNYPVATAPAFGVNVFFAYTVCLGMHVKRQTALVAVFVALFIFILITMFKLRGKIIDAIPVDLKHAISAGIGLSIAFLGLVNAGLVEASRSIFVTVGSLKNSIVWIAILGLLVTIVLMIMNVPGAISTGIVLAAIFDILTEQIKLPTAVVSSAPSIAPTFGQAFKHIDGINMMQVWVIVLTFLLVTSLDTTGTLIGLVSQTSLMKDNKMSRIGQALVVDSGAMMAGSILGTSPVDAYVESSVGVAVGGKSGLTAVFVEIFFLISVIFSSLLSVITTQVTAPALIIVGVLMAQNLAKIDWTKLEVAVPALLIVVGMPLTYSVSDGLLWGMITYPITMIAAKRGKEISPMMWVLFFIFIIFMWILNA